MHGFKQFVCVLALLSGSGAPVPSAAGNLDPLTAKTGSGSVQGEREGGLVVFKGLPYAAPPVGALRWREPRDPASWKGVRKADRFGNACIQVPGAAAREGAGDPGPLGEDCLTLNVWSPGLDAGGKRPVMVWIHGGALVLGAGSQAAFDGTAFARRGAVVVTLNYRLGALGFFDHPALASQPGGIVNYGLLDQVAALRWVQRNISAFGGDPGNVTIFGESAGAQSVLALFASRKARGLFHRGIAQSAYGIPANARAKAREASIAIAVHVGLDGARATAAQLRAIPAQRLGQAGATKGMSLAPGFVVGDAVLPVSILDAFQQRRQAKLPLIIGSNSDEATVAVAFGLDPGQIVQRLGASRILLKPLYPGVSDNAQLGREVVRDLAFTAFARRIAYLHSQSAPTWRYYFSHVPGAQAPAPPGVGHGGEIPFVLGTFDTCRCLPVRFTAADRALARTVGDYWHAFARSGAPAAPGAPAWPKDSVRRAQVLEFGENPVVRSNFMRARLDVLISALKGAERLLQPAK